MSKKRVRKAPAEWVQKNLKNREWWTDEHYWNICCDTCEFNCSGRCGGKFYHQQISEIKKEHPEGCKAWGIALDPFCDTLEQLEAAGARLD